MINYRSTWANGYWEEVDSTGSGVHDLYNGTRQWKQTKADCVKYMMMLNSTKVGPDNVSQIGMNDNNVQPTWT